jgi:hypothetical protein
MAQHKIEYWMTDVSVMETELFDDRASCDARWTELCSPQNRAWATNVYHKDANGDWQPGLE